MTTETMLDALKIMIQKSSDARGAAAKTIMAIFAKSPFAQRRYNIAVSLAMSDQGVDWSQSELELIMSYVSDYPETQKFMLPINLSDWTLAQKPEGVFFEEPVIWFIKDEDKDEDKEDN